MMLDALEQTNLLHSIAEEPGSAFFFGRSNGHGRLSFIQTIYVVSYSCSALRLAAAINT